MKDQYFKASMDGTTKAITYGLMPVIFLVSIVAMSMDGFDTMDLLLQVPLLLICVILYLFRPKGYRMDVDELIIDRDLSPKVVKLRDISDVKALSSTDVSGTIRTFGVGGFFGFWGKFYNKNLGHTNYYASRNSELLLIELIDGKKYVISPDDDTFEEVLKNRLKNS